MAVNHDAAYRDALAWIEFEQSGLSAKLPDIDSFNLTLAYLDIREREDALFTRVRHLEEQRDAEEAAAMHSGGILSDICDIVFDDSERAIRHGYDGVREKVIELKRSLVEARKEAAEWRDDSRGRVASDNLMHDGAPESTDGMEWLLPWEKTGDDQSLQED